MKSCVSVIGCGRWGKHLIRTFASLGALSSVCDRSPERAQEKGEPFGARFQTWQEILADTAIEAVAIAVPSQQHVMLALEALEAGKHVFVEKPMALSVQGANQLCEKARQKNRILMTGHIMRYHPAFLMCKQMVADGVIGPLRSLVTQRASWGRVHGQSHAYSPEDDAIWDLLPHDISMILELLQGEKLLHLEGWGMNHFGTTLFDNATIRLEFSHNIQVFMHASWIGPEKKRCIQITGDRGTLVFDDLQPWNKKLALYHHTFDVEQKTFSAGDIDYIALDQDEPLLKECAHFLAAIRGQTPLTEDGAEGLAVLNVLEHIHAVLSRKTSPLSVDKTSLELVDLATQQKPIRKKIEEAVSRVLDHGQYILGPEVTQLEERLQDYCQVQHAITCSNGTSALVLALMALGLCQGEGVLLPTFTFIATAEAVVLAGGVPIFVDVLEDTYNIDPKSLQAVIIQEQNRGQKIAGIITVDLFGQPADYQAIHALAKSFGLWIIADAAQSFGALYAHRRVGNLADITATSFFPSKPLGCYGDGGALLTNNDIHAEVLRSLRNHGAGEHRYDNIRIGMNARLDSLQAAILLEKLPLLDEECYQRASLAGHYNLCLKEEASIGLPIIIPEATSCWSLYTIRLKDNATRQRALAHLESRGIQARVYYPTPVHKQKAYVSYAWGNTFPVSEALAQTVLSLPLSCSMSLEDVAAVSNCLFEGVVSRAVICLS